MTRYNGCGCGGHNHGGCNPCTSHNEIQQAVNDALALEKENLEQYENNAAQSATDAAKEADKAATSASAAAQSQTNAETAAGTATQAASSVTNTAVVLEETAERIEQAQDLLEEQISALNTKPVYFEVSSPTSSLVLPETETGFNVRSIYVASARQDVGYGFTFDKATRTITLADGITADDIAETEEGFILITAICDVYSSDDPTSFPIILAAPGGASLVGPGVMSRGLDKFSIMQGRNGEYRQNTLTRGLSVELKETISGIGFAGATNTYMFNRLLIADDRVDAQNDGTPATKVDGLIVQHNFGGAGTRGGRHAGEFILTQTAPTELDNSDRNYVGVVGLSSTNTGDGGDSNNYKGAYYGANLYTSIKNSMYVAHANGCEANVKIDANSSVKYRTGVSAVSGGEKQADIFDAGFSVGALGLTGAKWRDGLLIGNQNGRNPVERSMMRGENVSLQSVVSFNGSIPGSLIVSDTDERFKFRTDRLEMYYPNASLSLGSKTAANTPFIDAYTDASGNRAGRIIFTGTALSELEGVCNIQFRQTTVRELVPSSAAKFNCGTSALPWAGGNTQTAFNVTSDERHKTKNPPILARGVLDLPVSSDESAMQPAFADAILDAWAEVNFVQFQYLDRVEEKGEDGARWHFGVIAQRVKEAFERHGLDAHRFGFLCYDEWDDHYEKVQTNVGVEATKTRLVERPVSVIKTRTVSQPVLETRWRETLVDEVQEDGTLVKKVTQEEYQTPKLTKVFIFNEDGTPRLEDGVHLFVLEPVLEDAEVEYADVEIIEVSEEYTELAEPEYMDVLTIPKGSRYGIRYEEALALEAALQRRNYDRMKAQYEVLASRVEALETK